MSGFVLINSAGCNGPDHRVLEHAKTYLFGLPCTELLSYFDQQTRQRIEKRTGPNLISDYSLH